MAGKVKPLRLNFGLTQHEQKHFEQHDEKPLHGVWGANLPQVRDWLTTALTSIENDDDRVVAWRDSHQKGRTGGHDILVDMGTQVGYLSGWRADPDRLRPTATHIEVALRKNGTVSNAFPSDPRVF